MREWQANNYSILRNNCCHFCNDLCQVLAVGGTPEWTMNLASKGAALKDNVVGATGALAMLEKEEEDAGYRPSGQSFCSNAWGRSIRPVEEYEQLQADGYSAGPLGTLTRGSGV